MVPTGRYGAEAVVSADEEEILCSTSPLVKVDVVELISPLLAASPKCRSAPFASRINVWGTRGSPLAERSGNVTDRP